MTKYLNYDKAFHILQTLEYGTQGIPCISEHRLKLATMDVIVSSLRKDKQHLWLNVKDRTITTWLKDVEEDAQTYAIMQPKDAAVTFNSSKYKDDNLSDQQKKDLIKLYVSVGNKIINNKTIKDKSKSKDAEECIEKLKNKKALVDASKKRGRKSTKNSSSSSQQLQDEMKDNSSNQDDWSTDEDEILVKPKRSSNFKEYK